MNRKLEKTVVTLAAIAVVIFLGGLSVVFLQMDDGTFRDVIVPAFQDGIPEINSAQGKELIRTIGAWFGVTAFGTALLTALGNLFLRGNTYPKRAAVCYGVTGLLILFGSQLIAYPFAFPFFVATGLILLRKPPVTDSVTQ